ncbi:kinase-like domain-containing protein [Mycena rebaudengoi]|nr:kinase-like domain-containing protein [Mycena rebaudengoi]
MDALSGLDVPTLTILDEGPEPVAFGGFGQIHQARVKDGPLVAVKYCRLTGPDVGSVLKDLRREVKTWHPLNHQNLVKLLGVVPNPQRRGGSVFPGMITVWHENGDAVKYLAAKGAQATTGLRLKIVAEAALGLQYLHSKGLLHGDLKGNNILIDGNGTACLTDFGLSTVLMEGPSNTFQRSNHNAGGNARWQDPVLALGDPTVRHTYDTDVFAFGRLMLEILCDKLPFHNRSNVQVVVALMNKIQPEISLPPDLDNRARTLMLRCWEETNRPSALHIARSLNDIRSERTWKPLSDVIYDITPIMPRTYRGRWTELDGHPVPVTLIIPRWGEHASRERYSKRAVTRLVATLTSLLNPHIIQIFGTYPTPHGDAIVMPWIERGPLVEYLKQHPSTTQSMRVTWAVQISSAVAYLHSRQTVHGKLGLTEVYLGDHLQAMLKVTLEYYISTESRNYSFGRSAGDDESIYLSPELLVGAIEDHTAESDVWALGMIAYELLSGERPFHSMPFMQIIMKITNGERPSRTGSMYDLAWNAIQDCWHQNPQDRVPANAFQLRLSESNS